MATKAGTKKQQLAQQEILLRKIEEGPFHWRELSQAIRDAGVAPENWMTVRGMLQYQLNAGTIMRDPDLTQEKYLPTKASAENA